MIEIPFNVAQYDFVVDEKPRKMHTNTAVYAAPTGEILKIKKYLAYDWYHATFFRAGDTVAFYSDDFKTEKDLFDLLIRVRYSKAIAIQRQNKINNL